MSRVTSSGHIKKFESRDDFLHEDKNPRLLARVVSATYAAQKAVLISGDALLKLSGFIFF